MNWDEVRLFLVVAEEGSFRQAALKLNVGHSTLSRRIESLEEDLGLKLFKRIKRGLSLTAAGEEMLKTAIPMGEEFDKLKIRLAAQDQLHEPYQAPLETLLTSANIQTQVNGARQGFGMASLPCLMADLCPELIRISAVIKRSEICLLAHKDSRHNKHMRIFRDFIADYFAEHQNLLIGARQNAPTH